MQIRSAPNYLVVEEGLRRYLDHINGLPMLEAVEEFALARRWREHEDADAAQKLAASHLRLVAKVAMRHRGYGLPIADMISEGNIGLLQAIRRFDPDRGFRLSTYALWWIRAAIQDYVLRSWSIVRIGAGANRKKLFFGLRRAKQKISAYESGDLRPDQAITIAARFRVPCADVTEMNRRLAGDASLNTPMRLDGSASTEWQDQLADESLSAESVITEREEAAIRRRALERALASLSARDLDILQARRLRDEPASLAELAHRYGVSRERIRQLEVRAFIAVQQAVVDGPMVSPAQLRPRRQASSIRAGRPAARVGAAADTSVMGPGRDLTTCARPGSGRTQRIACPCPLEA